MFLRPLLCFALAVLAPLAAPVAAETFQVVLGFYEPDSVPPAKELRAEGHLFRLHSSGFPIDRVRMRNSQVVYAERFPPGAELFRDDLVAFELVANRGGVVFLFAPPQASADTIANMTYLGKRFGFAPGSRIASGHLVPAAAGEGPLDGNVWPCEHGARLLELVGSDWRVHYRTSDAGKEPVIASRRWGAGLIVVSGTLEIDRRLAERTHNALTLVHWGIKEARKDSVQPPAPVGAAPAAEQGLVPDYSAAGKPGSVEEPSSDLLSDRLAVLRRLYWPGGSGGKLTGRSWVLERGTRSYFLPMQSTTDVDGRPASTYHFRGRLVLVVYFAAWDSASSEYLGGLLEAIGPYRARGTAILAVSLDNAAEEAQALRERLSPEDALVCDGLGFRSPLAEEMAVKTLPRLFLLDRSGRIAATDLAVRAVPAAVEELLGEAQ